MKTKVITEIPVENGIGVVSLDTNYNIAKINVTLGGEKEDTAVNATIEYAKNRVTSDLIWFSDATGKVNSTLEFVPNAPVAATDIYVTLSDPDAFVRKMELFMAEDVDLARCYPLYVDKDLKKNYFLDTVTVHTPSKGYSQYTLYTSMDGRDFDEVARKTSKDLCPESGEVYNLNGKEAILTKW